MGLNFACVSGHTNCSLIQPDGKCYKVNDLPALASYAYNDYYQLNAASGATCNFSGTATTTPNDPNVLLQVEEVRAEVHQEQPPIPALEEDEDQEKVKLCFRIFYSFCNWSTCNIIQNQIIIFVLF